MTHNSDMIKLVHLLEGKQQFAGEEVGQKPGDQVRGTDKAKTGGKDHPFKGRLVGEDTTLEDVLSKKYQDFKDLQAKEKAEKKEKEVDEEKQRLDPKCWDGYKKQGTKMKGDTRVNNCVPESVRIGSNLPQSDTETFGLEKGRGYKINTPKDWKPGDRPRAMQQLIPTQDKKDHIRSRLGKHKSPVLPEQDVAEGFDEEHSPVTQAITRRIIIQRTDLLAKYGPEKVAAAIDDVADFVGDVDEIGSSDVSGWVRQVEQSLSGMGEGMTADQKLSELGATPPPAPGGTATAAPTTGNATPTAGSVSPDEQTALNKIQTNPAMKQQLDKLMTQATPGAANKPMELNPEQEDALEKIKANAGLKTQYDKIIKQANPQAKV